MRLIDADILMDYVERQTRRIPAKEYDNDGFYHYSGWNGACVMARCAIKDTPTVDAVEVVRGRWAKSEAMVRSAKCSNCKGWVTKHSVNEPDFKYCPHCGAKMDGGKDRDR